MRPQRYAIIITRLGERNRLPLLPWLENDFGVEEADWIVLTDESWRALAIGDEGLLADFERKLIRDCYVHKPDFIVVVGYPAGEGEGEISRQWHAEQVLDRVRNCLLARNVTGFWITDADGVVQFGERCERRGGEPHHTGENDAAAHLVVAACEN